MMESTNKTKKTDMGYLLGQIKSDMKVSSKWIKGLIKDIFLYRQAWLGQNDF